MESSKATLLKLLSCLVALILVYTVARYLYPLLEPNINTVEKFPDHEFRREVEKFMEVKPNGHFTARQCASKRGHLECPVGTIRDLTGIEYFTGITGLWVYCNKLTTLDISRNTQLRELNCAHNNIRTIDVTHNSSLKKMICHTNQLSDLDLTRNHSLEVLHCAENLLRNIDLFWNTKLVYLNCTSNEITNLDISSNCLLETLHCSNNKLTTLDLSMNESLKDLICVENPLSSIKISANARIPTMHVPPTSAIVSPETSDLPPF